MSSIHSRQRKLTRKQVLSIPRLLREGMTWTQAAEHLNISNSMFAVIVQGRSYPDVQAVLQPKLKAARQFLKALPKPEHYTCAKCRVDFPRTAEFSPLSNRRAGFEGRCRTCKSIQNRNRYQTYRLEALRHYAGGEPACACCRETTVEFLTFDHMNGGGAKHRESLRGKAASFALWLKNNGYPSGYRVLCMNCNLAVGVYGTCPHQR